MSLVKIFDNAFAGIKPPEEITVNAILKPYTGCAIQKNNKYS